jgi:hypothetical protein
MQEILARRSGKSQPPPAKAEAEVWPKAPHESRLPPVPPRMQGPLKWQKPEAGSLGVRTVDEWYSCCKVMLEGVWTYEIWTRAPLTGGMKQIAVGLPSFDEAKKVAQADADAKAT